MAKKQSFWETIKTPEFGKRDVLKLLTLIAGDKDNMVNMEQFIQWHNLIMFAIKSMRSTYVNRRVRKDYPIRVYYQTCWEKIEAAKDDKELLNAIDSLRSSIEME